MSTSGTSPSPVWLVLCSILSVQFGAAIAKGLFDEVSPTSMVWLRLITSSIVLAAIARPRLRGRGTRDWQAAVGLGAALGLMNWSIYHSFAEIPLGLAVTIEFLGPLSVALLGSRRRRDLIWVFLAGVGVAALGTESAHLTVAGVLYALLAAVMWGVYILLSAETGKLWPGLSGLAVASVVASVGLTPVAIADSGADLWDGRVLLLGAAVGILSSAIPYSLEMIALRRIRPAVFGILMSLEPAAAAGAAMLLLGEFLTPLQWLAITCVVAASIGATRSSRTAPPTEPTPLG